MRPRVEVDFNSRDSRGNIPGLATHVEEQIVPGLEIEMFDDEGNGCLGIVATAAGDLLSIEPQWATFTRGTANRVADSDTA